MNEINNNNIDNTIKPKKWTKSGPYVNRFEDINCDICGHTYKRTNKSHHEKSLKHSLKKKIIVLNDLNDTLKKELIYNKDI